MKQTFQSVSEAFYKLQLDWLQALKGIDPTLIIQCDDVNDEHHCNHVRAIHGGQIIEKGAIHFSRLRGNRLPTAATERFPDYHHEPFDVTGMSLIIHPKHPHAPTVHANVRYFSVKSETLPELCWFGGGADLTPHFVYEDDARAWHQSLYQACEAFEPGSYQRFKAWCDDYFFLPHRQETRGIGGVFFDYLHQSSPDACVTFAKALSQHVQTQYLNILHKRSDLPIDPSDVEFQRYRRGRYVEFNLLHDRGTRFGLEYGSRTESVLNSMPPNAKWEYQGKHSAQLALAPYLVKGMNWVD